MRKRTVGAPLLVRASPLDPCRGILQFGPLRLPCALGRAGRTSRKREGDGGTPLGDHAIEWGWMRRDRTVVPASPLTLASTRPHEGWCDAPDDACYNRPVRLPHRSGAETLCRKDRLYDVVIVLDYNYRERVRGRGSAIFLHVAKPGYPPTEGCVALSPADMRRILPYLRRGRVLRVL